MILRLKDHHKNKFPKHRIGDYRCPVAIWNKKGKPLWY